MTPLELAIHICGTQTELARRVTGRAANGFVTGWLRRGISPRVAVGIEKAVADAIREDPAAAARAAAVGGPVRVEQLLPKLRWVRDDQGRVLLDMTAAGTATQHTVCCGGAERNVSKP